MQALAKTVFINQERKLEDRTTWVARYEWPNFLASAGKYSRQAQTYYEKGPTKSGTCG